MKRLHISTIVFTALLSVSLAQLVKAQTDVSEKEQIREMMQQWDNSLVNHNWEFIDSILATDFAYIGSSGRVQNKAEHLASIKSPDLKIESSSSNNFVIRVYNNMAIAIAEGRIKGSYKSKEFDNHYRYTDVWIKEKGKWMVVNTQITDLR